VALRSSDIIVSQSSGASFLDIEKKPCGIERK